MVSALASSAGTESNLILDHYPHPRGPPLRLRTQPPQKCGRAGAVGAASGPLRIGGAWFPLEPSSAIAPAPSSPAGSEKWAEPQKARWISLRLFEANGTQFGAGRRGFLPRGPGGGSRRGVQDLKGRLHYRPGPQQCSLWVLGAHKHVQGFDGSEVQRGRYYGPK